MAEKIIFVEGDLTTGDGKIYGEFLNPIKMALLHESDINEKKNGALSYLFNMEKSRNSSEAIVGQEGFNVYSPKNEGDEAEYDTFKNTDSKVIRHLTYAKTFKISMEAAEDAKFGLTTTMRSGATELVRSYYSTRNYLAEMALAKATDASFSMGSGTNAKTLDLTTGDGKALFANDHGTNSNKCNYFKVGAEGLQATEDIEAMAAILPTAKSYMETSTAETWKKRIPWLLLLMISSAFTGAIISHYETALGAYVILTAFIPMLMGSGGNAGGQASVTIIRGISLGEIGFKDIFKVVFKELKVSLLCAVTMCAANFIKKMLVDFRAEFTLSNLTLATVVSLTLFCTIIAAKIIGASLPLIVKRIGLDPAVMASPFITTIVDAISLVIYFNFATAFLGI